MYAIVVVYYMQFTYFVSDRLPDPQERANDQGKCCGLSQNENQYRRKFNEICLVHRCICKESRKNRENIDEKGSVTKMAKLYKPNLREV